MSAGQKCLRFLQCGGTYHNNIPRSDLGIGEEDVKTSKSLRAKEQNEARQIYESGF